MSRNTQITPEEANDPLLQAELDKLWDFIENKYEDEWRVEFNGTMSLQVTEGLLERILRDNPIEASLHFGAHEEHNPENERYEWSGFPEHLTGLYSITGVYSNHYTLVDGPREYFFEQGY